MKQTIKLLMTFLMLCAFLQPAGAQVTDTKDQIMDIGGRIIDKLNAVQKSNSRGSWNGKTLAYWNYVSGIKNNEALFEFTYPGNDNGGINEHDYRYRIDLSKIRRVTMGKTRSGNDGFFFYADEGKQAIQEYVKNHDWTVGDYKYRSNEWEKSATIHMPQDEELLGLFEEYIILIKADKKVNPNDYGTLNEPEVENTEPELSAKDKATLETFDGIMSILGNAWEISGSASFTPFSINGDPGYDPVKAYDIYDARFTMVYKIKRFNINLAPAGFSWISLPSYRKYNSAGAVIDYDDFGSVQFYAPSLGFSYQFTNKKNKGDDYRTAEFPLAVHFAPLLAGKSKEVTIKNEAYDSQFNDYFEGLQYSIHATIGANYYFSTDYGIGFSAGGTYVKMNPTDKKLTQTNSNNQQSTFTIKMDDLRPYVPRFELRFISRF